MMRHQDFAAFILTHGRAKKVKTYNSLLKGGYTGKIYIVIDNEDSDEEVYRTIYGDKVVKFDKAAIAKTFDEGDNFGDRRAIIYARNACFQLARDLGIKYFIELDDDYTDFRYKFKNADFGYGDKKIKCLDTIFDALLDFYISTPTSSIAMAHGGDFIGGKDGSHAKSVCLLRKCMNSFICSTDRPFQFIGRINEDVNTYTHIASLGKLFFTVNLVCLQQLQTQSNSGGMTELYLDNGTFVKSFYSIMYQPSSVKIAMMGETSYRLHHSIQWNNTVPKILSEKYHKPQNQSV